MKKIISLFISTFTICSVLLCSSVFGTSASPVTLVEVDELLNIRSDGNGIDGLTSAYYREVISGGNTIKTVSFYEGGSPIVDTPSYNNMVFNAIKTPTTTNPTAGQVRVCPNTTGALGTADNVVFRFSGKFYTSVQLDTAQIQACGPNYKRVNMYVTNTKADGGTTSFIPGVWYDFIIELDLKNDSGKGLKYEFKSMSDASVLSDSTAYGGGVFEEMFLGFKKAVAGEYRYWADLKAEIIGDTVAKAEILSVGSGGEVPQNQNTVEFVLNKSIDGLTKEHISVIDTQGTKLTADDITITSAGTDSDSDGNEDMIVTATMSDEFLEWSNYVLNISGKSYGGYKELNNGSLLPVSDFTIDFYTPAGSFGVKDPQIAMSDGEVIFTTQIINENAPTPLTLMLAVYDEYGEMKALKPITISNSFTAAYPGFSVTISADLSSGQTAELFMINGWSGMRPLFGKSWKTSYSELNP